MRRLLLALVLALWPVWAYAQAQNGPIPAAQILLGSASSADTAGLSASVQPPPSRIAFVCGLNISGLGATSQTNVVATLGNLSQNFGTSSSQNGTLNFTYSFPNTATSVAVPVVVNFFPCLPGPAGGNITLFVPGAAGNTSTTLNIWGYYQ